MVTKNSILVNTDRVHLVISQIIPAMRAYHYKRKNVIKIVMYSIPFVPWSMAYCETINRYVAENLKMSGCAASEVEVEAVVRPEGNERVIVSGREKLAQIGSSGVEQIVRYSLLRRNHVLGRVAVGTIRTSQK